MYDKLIVLREFINKTKVSSNVGESSGYFYFCVKQFVNLFTNCCFDVHTSQLAKVCRLLILKLLM